VQELYRPSKDSHGSVVHQLVITPAQVEEKSSFLKGDELFLVSGSHKSTITVLFI
jgi:hypothetical protein